MGGEAEAHAPDVEQIAAAHAKVRQRIEDAGGDPDAVRLVAVTKRFGPEVVAAALEAGLSVFGENYVQELVSKHERLRARVPGPLWHLIGPLQSNKARAVAGLVACYQTMDRPSILAEVARRDPGAKVLIQVNATGEDAKAGCPPDATASLVERARSLGLEVQGLMTMGVHGDLVRSGAAFELVRSLADELGLPERSMGMSGDLETAVAAGATMVRVGTDLFGPRPDARVRGGDVGD